MTWRWHRWAWCMSGACKTIQQEGGLWSGGSRAGGKRVLYLHQKRSRWLRAVVMVIASTKSRICKGWYFHLFTAGSYNCVQPAWKGSEENESRLLEGESAGGISLISVANTKKGYIIREKQSPFHPSLSVFYSMYSLNPPISISPSLPTAFLFFMLHNGILRNLYLPLYPSSSSIIPLFVLYSLLLLFLLHLLPAWPVSHFPLLYLITLRGPPCCDPGHR